MLAMTHEETVTFHFSRARLVPRPAEDPVPLPDQGPRRAAAARRPPARARVRDEGRVLVRPRRGRCRRELPEARRRVRAHLRPLRARGRRGAGRVRDDGRERVDRLPRSVRLGREHPGDVRERRLRGRSRDRTRRAAGTGRSRSGSTSRGGRDTGDHDDRRARRVPRHRPGGDVEGDAGDEGRRHGRPRPDPRRRPARRGEAGSRPRKRVPTLHRGGDPSRVRRRSRLARPRRVRRRDRGRRNAA